jgi:hypothetical protein
MLVCAREVGEKKQMMLGFQRNRQLTGFVLGDDKLGRPMKINSRWSWRLSLACRFTRPKGAFSAQAQVTF